MGVWIETQWLKPHCPDNLVSPHVGVWIETFVMDYQTWDMYDQYLSGKSSKYTDNRDENQRKFRGVRVIPMVALPDNTIILGKFTSDQESNLWMGVDYANDANVLQVERLQANSELYFIKMILKVDVNIVKRDEVVAQITYD